MQKDVLELSTKAWAILDEALTTGYITLKDKNGEDQPRLVGTDTLIDVAVKLSQAKIRQPRVVAKPEDFNLQKTRS